MTSNDVDLRVLMPFTRWQHLELYREHLRDQGVTWVPIHSLGEWVDKVHEEQTADLFAAIKYERKVERKWALHGQRFPDADWICPFVLQDEPDYKPGAPLPLYWKLNKFVKSDACYPSAWYWLTADDNWWSAGAFQTVKQHIAARMAVPIPPDVLIVTQARGIGHGKEGMIPNTGAPRSFRWDMSMTIARGSALKAVPFREHLWWADTWWHEEAAHRGLKFEPCPGACSYYNALRPEAWGCQLGGGK